MSPLSRRRFVGAAAAATVAPLAAARAQAPSLLRVRADYELISFDPAFRVSSADGDVLLALFPGLLRRKMGESWGWELDLADMVEQVDPTHIRFRLKPGIPWTNGFGTITADDVKFSYERYLDPALKAPYITDWSSLDHVEVTDELSGVIVLKQPFAPMWFSTLPANSGAILPRKAVEALDGKRIATAVPASSGPYKVKALDPKRSITLERNPAWPFAKPAYDEVRYITIADANASETAFQAGELDFAGLPLSSVGRLQKATPRGSKLTVRPSLAYIWMGMQSEVGPLADIRLRRAIQYALDVDQVLEGAFFGAAERATGFIAPGLVGHRPANKIAKPDPDRARALLREAGQPNGFKTNIRVGNSTEFVSSAQIVAASLSTVGIDVEVIPMERAAIKALADDANGGWKQMGLVISRFTMQPDPSWATAWFVRKQIGVWNFERFASEEFDTLEAKAKVELDAAKRHEMYVRMQDLMEDSGSYVFLTHGANASIYRDSVVPGLAPDGQNKFFRDFARA